MTMVNSKSTNSRLSGDVDCRQAFNGDRTQELVE